MSFYESELSVLDLSQAQSMIKHEYELRLQAQPIFMNWSHELNPYLGMGWACDFSPHSWARLKVSAHAHEPGLKTFSGSTHKDSTQPNPWALNSTRGQPKKTAMNLLCKDYYIKLFHIKISFFVKIWMHIIHDEILQLQM